MPTIISCVFDDIYACEHVNATEIQSAPVRSGRQGMLFELLEQNGHMRFRQDRSARV